MSLQQEEEDSLLLRCDASDGNYSSNTQFEANLGRILLMIPTLALQSPHHMITFYNATVGQDPDHILGFAKCMSATTVQDCHPCLNKSVATLMDRCSNAKRAFIRYYNCTIRYSDHLFFSGPDTTQTLVTGRADQVSDSSL